MPLRSVHEDDTAKPSLHAVDGRDHVNLFKSTDLFRDISSEGKV
jgi:hypothetical protein